MRKTVICLMSIVSVLIVQTGHAAMDKRYLIKSGIIEYDVTGMQEGTTQLYFDQYGAREGRWRNVVVSFMGIKQNINEVDFIAGDIAYHYDEKTDSATKVKFKEVMDGIKKSSGEKGIQDFGEDMLKSMGGVKTGTKNILGRTCDVWNVADFGTTTCIYKRSIPLEVSVKFAGIEMNEIAVSFKENVAVPQEKVVLPKSAAIRDLGDVSQVMNRSAGQSGEAGDAPQIQGLGDVMNMLGNLQQQAQQPAETSTGMSERELELKEKELELMKRELELQRQMNQNDEAESSPKGALDGVKDAVNTSKDIKSTINGFKSLFGR